MFSTETNVKVSDPFRPSRARGSPQASFHLLLRFQVHAKDSRAELTPSARRAIRQGACANQDFTETLTSDARTSTSAPPSRALIKPTASTKKAGSSAFAPEDGPETRTDLDVSILPTKCISARQNTILATQKPENRLV